MAIASTNLLLLVVFLCITIFRIQGEQINLQQKFVPPTSIFTTTKFSNEPLLYYRFTVADWKQYSLHLPNPTSYVFSNNSAIIFAPYHTNFYTLGQYWKSFGFFEPELQLWSIQTILSNISTSMVQLSDENLIKFHESAILSILLANGSSFASNNMFGCVEQSNSPFSSIYEFRNKLYYCCDVKGDCRYKTEPSLYVLAQVLLHFMRFGFAVIILSYITGKFKYFHQNEFMLTHMTNSYFMPDFWLAALIPPLKKYSYNVKNWIICLLIGVFAFVFLLCIVFAIQPLDPIRNESQKENPQFLFVSTERFFKWDTILYSFVFLPVLFPLTIIVTIIKFRVPRNKHNRIALALKRKAIGWIERILRFVICLSIGLVLALVWILLMYISNVLSEFHAVMLFVTGATCVMGITVYMLLQQPQTSYYWALMRLQKKKTVDADDGLLESDEHAYVEMLTTAPESSTDMQEAKVKSRSDKLLEEAVLPTVLYSNNVVELYLFYVVPTYIFEMIWLTCTFYLTFIAATVLTRFIWASLLLFALYPEQLNLYVYLLTIFGAIIKFATQLNQPYELVKTKIIQEKSLVLRDSIDSWNDFMKTMTEETIKERLKLSAYVGYYIPVSWKYFMQICKEINTMYFLRGTLFRMVLTILILLIFFLISHVFGKSIFGQSDFFKFLVTSLMPLIPSIIDTLIPAQTESEIAVFNSRFKAAMNTIQSTETKKAFHDNPPLGMFGHLVVVREEKEKQE